MKRSIITSICISTFLLFFLYREVYSLETKPVQRFAIIVGSNDGGSKRIKLKYALADADAVSRTFEELGGISKESKIILKEPKPQEFLASFKKLDKLIMKNRNAGRTEAVFYYSGHSDEKGLLLGNNLIRFKDLKRYIKELSSDVKIAIIDSCSYGVLVRLKGGDRMGPFLLDSSIETKGYAIISSSSETEAAQESDRIRGSFFTHYLIAGLRGAADMDGNKRVTFNEAYQYAFQETLTTTKDSRSGPQHPGYDIQMKGAGDLILTDIQKASSGLKICRNIFGKVYIHNKKDNFFVELNKKYDLVTIGLKPGKYEITWKREDGYYLANSELDNNSFSEIDEGDFFILENGPDFLEKTPALKPSIATLYAQPLYSAFYGDVADRLGPSVGMQVMGFIPVHDSYFSPAGIMGFQANSNDNLFIFYIAVGGIYSLNISHNFGLSVSLLCGFADGMFEVKHENADTKDDVDFYQPIVISNFNINYNLNRQFLISLSFQAKHYIDPKIDFGSIEVVAGMGFRVF